MKIHHALAAASLAVLIASGGLSPTGAEQLPSPFSAATPGHEPARALNAASGTSPVLAGTPAAVVAKRAASMKAPVKKKPAARQSFTSKARVILNRHGCKSSKIRLNDKRLGRYANGAADWHNNTILLRSTMPAYRLNYVAAHECMHMRQYRAYRGNVKALSAAMNKIYGGRGFTGLERNADCMTRAVGITVTNKAYASSCKGAKGSAAKRILAGKRA